MRNNTPIFINNNMVGGNKINPFNQIAPQNQKLISNQHPILSNYPRNNLNRPMYASTIQPSNSTKYVGKLQTMGRFVQPNRDKPEFKFQRNEQPVIPKHQKNPMFSSSIFVHNSSQQVLNRFPSFNLHPSKEKPPQQQPKVAVKNQLAKESLEQKRKKQIEAIKKQLEDVTRKLEQANFNNKKKNQEKVQIHIKPLQPNNYPKTSHLIQLNLPNKTSPPLYTHSEKIIADNNQLSISQLNDWGRKSGKLKTDITPKSMFEEKDKFYIGSEKESNKPTKTTNYFDKFLIGEEIEVKNDFVNQKNGLKQEKKDPFTNLTKITEVLASSSSSTSSESSNLSENKKLSNNITEKTFMKKKQPYYIETVNNPIRVLQKPPQVKNQCVPRTSYQLKNKLQHKTIKKSDFQIGKKMGKGQFGEVLLVRHKITGFICGMKVMEKKQIRDQKYQNQISRQLSIQFYLMHRNIAPLYGYFSDQKNVYLLVQFCTDGQLLEKLRKDRRMTEEDTSPIIKQICEGVDYIHRQLIIHRDIKPQNILFSFGVVKICDFGWAVYRGQGLRKTASGSPLYYSPQIVLGNQYDEKIDIWDIGMMSYECLLGKVPFRVYSELDLKRIVTDQVKFPEYVDVSEQAKDFILKTLQKCPQERMEIRQMMRHPFITKHSQKKLSQEIMEDISRVIK